LASIAVSDGRQGVTRFQARFSLPLRIMGGLVAVLLAISCANVSGLLLARLSGRQREVAVRLSIGAGRGSLVRQFLTEGVLLAGLGGLLSIFIAWWGSGILLALASSEAEPILIDVSPNLRTLFVTGALFSVAVLSVGLAPALASSRANLSSVLKATVLSRQRSQMLPSLVIAQVALSFLLLTGAILLVQTLRNLRAAAGQDRTRSGHIRSSSHSGADATVGRAYARSSRCSIGESRTCRVRHGYTSHMLRCR
jgi:hypothetical protein